jgi:hypothetical protein
MYLDVWMQLAVVATFGCCAFISYRAGESKGRLIGGLQVVDFLRQENIITVDSGGIIKPFVIEKPKKRSNRTKSKINN